MIAVMIERSRLHFIFYNLLALLAGSALVFAFAPFHYYLLAILSPALLLFCWQQYNKPRQAFLLGWLFGFGQFAVGVSWIYISIHTYGETPMWFAALMALLLISFLALYPACQGYFMTRYFSRSSTITKSLIIFPASWMLFEWLRSTLLSGFPWLLLGYSQTTSIFGSWAPLVGNYGVTFIMTLISGLLLILVFSRNKHEIISSGFALLFLIGLSFQLYHHSWTNSLNKSLTASLIQGNITESLKWSEANFVHSLETYQQLTEPYWKSDVIVWPESAIAMPYEVMKDFMASQDELAKAHHTTLIIGIPFAAQQKDFYHNGIMALGTGSGHYYKQRLVMYAETLPLQWMFQGLLDHFNLPTPNVLPGDSAQLPLTSQDNFIAPFICYDIAYSSVVRAALPQAQVLMTISDDAWFGHSLAQAQHLEIAQMRSLQTGRYQMTITNNGLTSIIDNFGQISAKLAPYTQGVLTGKVMLMTGATPWVLWGDNPVLLFAGFLMLSSWYRQRYAYSLKRKEVIGSEPANSPS